MHAGKRCGERAVQGSVALRSYVARVWLVSSQGAYERHEKVWPARSGIDSERQSSLKVGRRAPQDEETRDRYRRG
jgi:hypothetical protein